jgi:hemerythrin
MAYIDWDDSLSTGVDEIDDQHRYLFALMNDVHECASCNDPDSDLVEDIMYRLVDYVTQHFEDEQALMRELGYAESGVHTAMHERLTAEVLRYMTRFVNGDDVSAVELVDFLDGWLRNHIRKEDTSFAAHARNRATT